MTAGVTILDGGMSRELVRLGAELRQPEWSALALIERPEIVRRVHEEFIAAGAGVITTNSYALVPFHIGEARFRAEGLALARRAGELARQAADAAPGGGARVAGCLPPVFGSYEPRAFDPSRVQDYLSVLVEGLAPYVDLWLGETLSLIAEGAAVKTATAATGKPFWISFTLDDGEAADPAGPARLRSGETVAAAAGWALEAGAGALLFNCSQPEFMAAAVRQAAGTVTAAGRALPLGVYANAFEPKPRSHRANEGLSETRGELTPELYLDFARDWTAAGARIIGGCCGIGVGHIHGLARAFGGSAAG
ncbi:homocysteine S-methyltransferase [Tistlia consotensis]|uniref:Homocysteine S-methyltransferase n=1 Tax=Tistlia consotensis USBA 355 TaxID=560819 RepID=A0A1Y6B2C4_9PROT|nr:homocysteine S-methyltransferase family protein [Tistlia consotensis]SME87993.1 homocysteine S-methyltransferase [Tistlia consotensis USBA 355]SNR24324.1 homocysteine S-methyltransferase [Tistlia consotensis]